MRQVNDRLENQLFQQQQSNQLEHLESELLYKHQQQHQEYKIIQEEGSEEQEEEELEEIDQIITFPKLIESHEARKDDEEGDIENEVYEIDEDELGIQDEEEIEEEEEEVIEEEEEAVEDEEEEIEEEEIQEEEINNEIDLEEDHRKKFIEPKFIQNHEFGEMVFEQDGLLNDEENEEDLGIYEDRNITIPNNFGFTNYPTNIDNLLFDQNNSNFSQPTNSRPKLKGYVCDVCKKIWNTPSRLENHLRIHTGEKPFVCDHKDCGKKFSDPSALKRHLKLHTGVKPFLCGIDGCPKRYPRRYQLEKHQSKAHNYGTQQQQPQKPYKPNMDPNHKRVLRGKVNHSKFKELKRNLKGTTSKNHHCQFEGCGKQFESQGKLVIHLRVHTGEKPFTCPIPSCKKSFSDPSAFARHKKTHSNENQPLQGAQNQEL